MLKVFQPLSVKMRLIGFILILLLLLFSAGLAGLHGMLVANNTLSVVYENHVIPLNELRSLENTLYADVLQPIDRLMNDQLTWEECLQQVSKAEEFLERGWRMFSYKSKKDGVVIADNRDEEAFKKAKRLVDRSGNLLETLVMLLKTKNNKQLGEYNETKLRPLAETYTHVIDELIYTILADIQLEYEKSQERYIKSRSKFIWSILVCSLLSIGLSLLLIKSINAPLAKITTAMQHLMKGDLTKRLSYKKLDEFGIVINGFNQMTQYLAELISEIERSGIQVTSSITEIAATLKEQEATVNEQAATSNQIAASSTEIAATGQNLMATMGKVNEMANNAAKAASEGHYRLTKINDIMASMDESTGSIVTKLSVLSEKASNITLVTQTINKIADQTNLLSLNAAIEAEKAGEYGTGFSVVSSEIRRLADQTAVATFDIEQMVSQVQSAIASGVMSIEKFAEDVKKSVTEIKISSRKIIDVIEQAQALQPPIASLNEGISAQSLGAKQISESIDQLNDAAQQTAESVSQTSLTTFQLNKAALILQDSVARFKLKSNKLNNTNRSDG